MPEALTTTPGPITISTQGGTIKLGLNGSVIIPDDLSFDAWCSQLLALKSIHGFYHKGLAQLAAYGRKAFGIEAVEQAFEQLEFDNLDAKHALAMSMNDDEVRDMPKLSSEHQYVLGTAFPDDPVKQREWAQKAVENDLKPSELKTSIAIGHVITREERQPGMLTFEFVAVQFQRCLTRMRPALATMTRAQKQQIARCLEPIANFVEELVEELKTS